MPPSPLLTPYAHRPCLPLPAEIGSGPFPDVVEAILARLLEQGLEDATFQALQASDMWVRIAGSWMVLSSRSYTSVHNSVHNAPAWRSVPCSVLVRGAAIT